MEVFKFRVVIDHEKDVFRDIEIQGSQNFEDLHGAIISAFDFRGDQMASFYMSNESWEKGQEIGLMDMSFGEETGPPTMNSALIEQFVKEKDQKILYVYDFLKMWRFHIQFIENKKAGEGEDLISVGAMPNEAPEISFDEQKQKKGFDPYEDVFDDFDEFNNYEY